jgi:hypothetical protein
MLMATVGSSNRDANHARRARNWAAGLHAVRQHGRGRSQRRMANSTVAAGAPVVACRAGRQQWNIRYGLINQRDTSAASHRNPPEQMDSRTYGTVSPARAPSRHANRTINGPRRSVTAGWPLPPKQGPSPLGGRCRRSMCTADRKPPTAGPHLLQLRTRNADPSLSCLCIERRRSVHDAGVLIGRLAAAGGTAPDTGLTARR